MLDRLGKNPARLIQAAAGKEHTIDLVPSLVHFSIL
jgi:hypothetical protein